MKPSGTFVGLSSKHQKEWRECGCTWFLCTQPKHDGIQVLAPVFGCVCHQLAESSKTILFDNSQIKECII